MLFNSLQFLFLFLPVSIGGFFMTGAGNVAFLCLASLVFYASWHTPDLFLLIASMGVNYIIGTKLRENRSRSLLALGVTANLLVIAWFKYAGFLAMNFNALAHGNILVPDIVLPLGVSFFTLHEVTWLVDNYQGKIKKAPFSHYVLYITFFPQLIAGPIVRFTEVMDQYTAPAFGRFNMDRFAQGALLFCIGLCKKVLLADYFASVASPIFNGAGAGLAVPALQAWLGALFYTFQIYFDFSAYSDMAIGLGLVFGIVLPLNFNSPYKATSIIEFWRRWHMTLSRFLRDYLYIPLGGNKNRHYLNLMLVMLIGGLWHGAAWTYVIWGGLHGLYLLVNHLYRLRPAQRGLVTLLYGPLTFLAVVVAWVFFRADSVAAAQTMLRAMAGFGASGKASLDLLSWFMGMLGAGIVFLAPNAHEIAARFMAGGRWRVTSLALGVATGIAVFLIFTGTKSEFIYFQF